MVPGPLTLWRLLRGLLRDEAPPLELERERAFDVLSEHLADCAEVVQLRPDRDGE